MERRKMKLLRAYRGALKTGRKRCIELREQAETAETPEERRALLRAAVREESRIRNSRRPRVTVEWTPDEGGECLERA